MLDARTGGSLGATWPEIDRDAKVWPVPARSTRPRERVAEPAHDLIHSEIPFGRLFSDARTQIISDAWARTEALSIIWMSPWCAAVMASIIRSHTPAFRHRTKRL